LQALKSSTLNDFQGQAGPKKQVSHIIARRPHDAATAAMITDNG